MQRGLADYTATGAELWVPDFLALLAQGHARAGRPAAGLDLLADALDRVGRTGDAGSRPSCTGSGVSCCWPFPSWTRSRPRLASDAPSRSPESRARGRGSCAPRRASPGCGAARTGRPTARDLLAPAYGWFTEGFDTPDLQEAKALLDVHPP